MSFLISGAGGGLGRYLHQQLGGDVVTRAQPVANLPPRDEPYEAIVHCAFNMRRDVTDRQFHDYLADTLLLTQQLLAVPHHRFIFVSTIDVYPVADRCYSEDSEFRVFDLDTPYALCKLGAESLIRASGTAALILRPGLLLGQGMRPNNLTRVVRGDEGALSLTADSGFRCVLYSDMLALVRQAVRDNLTGVLNAVRRDVVTMAELARTFGCSKPFGHFHYRPLEIDNRRVASLCPPFAGSSLDAVRCFVEECRP